MPSKSSPPPIAVYLINGVQDVHLFVDSIPFQIQVFLRSRLNSFTKCTMVSPTSRQVLFQLCQIQPNVKFRQMLTNRFGVMMLYEMWIVSRYYWLRSSYIVNFVFPKTFYRLVSTSRLSWLIVRGPAGHHGNDRVISSSFCTWPVLLCFRQRM